MHAARVDSMKIISFLICMAIICQCCSSFAFHASNEARCKTSSRQTQIFSNTKDDTDDMKSMTLNFVGETVITSKVAAIDDNKSLLEFFSLPSSPLLILRGSKNNKVVEIEMIDDELLTQYKESCERTGALPPTADDRFFDVTTNGVNFPGMEVLSLVTIGCKVAIDNDDFPKYELVLVRDTTFARGNRLFVWFFNKVTGKDKDETTSQTTFSLNRISVIPKQSGVAFEANASLNLLIKFPLFLMKAIPGASKDKFEKTGGKKLCLVVYTLYVLISHVLLLTTGESLVKALEDDLPTALEQFRQEYINWLSS